MKKLPILIVLLMSVTAFGSPNINNLRPRYSSIDTLHPEIVVAAANSTSAVRDIADYRCDGTADGVQIRAAAADANAAGGGTVRLTSGVYNISSVINTYDNIVIRGEVPAYKPHSGYISDLTPHIDGGTIIKGPNNITAFSSTSPIHGGGFYSLGIKDVNCAFDFGDTNEIGPQAVVWKDIYIEDTNHCGIKLMNPGQCFLESIYIGNVGMDDVTDWTGIHIISEHDNFQPGNTTIIRPYINWHNSSDTTSRTLRGILLESNNPSATTGGKSLNYMAIIRPQVNFFGFSGTKSGCDRYNFALIGDDTGGNSSPVQFAKIIGADLEGDNEYHLYLGKEAQNNQINIAGFSSRGDAVYNIYAATGSRSNTIDGMGTWNYFDGGNYNTFFGGSVVFPTQASGTTALNLLELLGNTGEVTMLMKDDANQTVTLPGGSRLADSTTYTSKGQKLTVKNIDPSGPGTGDDTITINTQEITSFTDKSYNAGSDFINLGGLTTNEYELMVVNITAASGGHLDLGLYAIEYNNTSVIYLKNASDDGSDDTVSGTIYEAISYTDGSGQQYTNAYTEVDAVGDYVTLISDGEAGWQVIERQIQ